MNSISMAISMVSATTTLPAPKPNWISTPNAARLILVVAEKPVRSTPDGSSTTPRNSLSSWTVRVTP
nr:hypothetical protein [Kribbella sp. VKM Ac-2568]